jgi:hypothetical protein
LAVSVKPTMCARTTTAASHGGFTIDQIGRITPSPTGGILLPAPEYGRSIGEAATAAPNKFQFNGVGGLRTYITITRIGDQSSR